jgi:hypothetical protein
MGTKNNPGKFDCYANAHPDEPMFVLLGRDPMAGYLVRQWARHREAHGEEAAKVQEARTCADAIDVWALDHGKSPHSDPRDEQIRALREAGEKLLRAVKDAMDDEHGLIALTDEFWEREDGDDYPLPLREKLEMSVSNAVESLRESLAYGKGKP